MGGKIENLEIDIQAIKMIVIYEFIRSKLYFLRTYFSFALIFNIGPRSSSSLSWNKGNNKIRQHTDVQELLEGFFVLCAMESISIK